MPDAPDSRARVSLEAGISVLSSAAICLLLRSAFPNRLRVQTDVVGYPIHSNFNIYGYFQTYLVLVVVFPVISLVVYHLISQRRRQRSPVLPHRLDDRAWAGEDEPGTDHPTRSAAGRLLFNATVLGLSLAFVVDPPRRWFWITVVGGALGFAGVVAGAAAARSVQTPPGSAHARVAGANALAVPLGVVMLAGISHNTRITVLSDGAVDPVRWMPLPLAIALALAVLVAVGRGLLRAGSEAEIRRTERWALLGVTAPIGLFLVFANLTASASSFDFFHGGEALAAAHLLADGGFPWRDVFFIHGLMQDVVQPAIGLWVVDRSYWGYLAGTTLLFMPLYFISHYALAVRLFGRNWLFLVLTAVLALNPYLAPPHNRFILQPLVLLLLAAMLAKPSKPRAGAFVLASFAHAILTPESTYLLIASGVAIVAFETYYRSPGQRLVDRYRRTLWCAGFAALFAAVWLLLLAAAGALASFFFYYQTFARDHALTGGIPLTGEEALAFRIAMVVPPVLVVLAFWYYAVKFRNRQPLAVEDWVMMVLAAFVVAYYQKFLSRADSHVYQPLGVSLPLLYFAVHKVLSEAERTLANGLSTAGRALRLTRYPLMLVVVLVALVAVPRPSLSYRLRAMPSSFHPTAPAHPEIERVGYSLPGAVPSDLISDVDKVLDIMLRPGDRLFDMTNNPALFYFILDAKPVTRYYHVSMAIRADTQHDLLRQLRRDRPKIVVLGGSTGLPGWDGIPNTVRHYEVSEYVLRNYRPAFAFRDMAFLLRRDVDDPPLDALSGSLSRPLSTKDILLNGYPCDWGYAPNFFADPDEPSSASSGVRLPFRQATVGNGRHEIRIELPPGVNPDRFSHLELEAADGFRDDSYILSTDPADDARAVWFKTLEGGQRHYRIRVGSCPQWFGFTGITLSLRHQAPQRIVAVRLYPLSTADG